MRKRVYWFAFSWIVILSLFSLSRAGNTGEVAGRILNYDNMGDGLLPKIVSLLDDRQRLDTGLEENGYFRFYNITPGRYYLMMGESIVLKPELEVLPDLTAYVSIDFTRPHELKSMEAIKLGPRRALRGIVLNRPFLSYPDKTSSGTLIWGDEEQRIRRKPLELNFKKYGRLRGYVTPVEE